MYKQFTTSVIVFKELKANTEVLMIHHKKFNRWMIPGGHVEVTENPVESAAREVFEESGVKIEFISFKHNELKVIDGEYLLAPEYLYQQLIPESSKEGAHFHIDMTYVSYATTYELTLNEQETNGTQWVAISNLPSIKTFDGTQATIIDAYNKMLLTLKKS